ncbi:MAG TPA: hypothetical protein VJM12_22510 [Pyrinomonadaceae bacterium]|nr:hypothetical protein [Pyrinomonadaceae bacterium]
MRQIDTLDADLTTERKNVVDAAKDIEKLKRDLKEAGLRENDQRNQKETVLAELRKREADLAELKTLIDMRITQAENITGHVTVTSVHAGDLMFVGNSETPPCVTLELRIRNDSLFNISIKPENVRGHLVFADNVLPEPISVIIDFAREPISGLRPFAHGSLVLYQPLRIADVEWIKSLQDSQKGRFRLTHLGIPISVDGRYSQYKVTSGNLRIHPDLQALPITAFRVTKSVDIKD